jgi:hypothetical protein
VREWVFFAHFLQFLQFLHLSSPFLLGFYRSTIIQASHLKFNLENVIYEARSTFLLIGFS